jgi:multidrug transporter EmrE-like cation transporter
MGIGIALVGLVQWFIQGRYKFEPLAMIGGATWATANLVAPFIIKRCGLGLGQLGWCVTNMLTGWATGAFGLFGIHKAEVSFPGLNYFGVALNVCALLVITQMGKKTEVADKSKLMDAEAGNEPAADDAHGNEHLSSSFVVQAPAGEAAGTSGGGFIIGLLVAMFAGVLMGSNFDVPTLLQQQGPSHGHSENPLDYVLSHYIGILALTSCFFLTYKATAKECYVGREIILPGLVAGVLWGIAQVCWFVANGALSFAIAFPMITGVPGVLAIIWGMVLFGENRDPRSLKLLAIIMLFSASSLACIAASH